MNIFIETIKSFILASSPLFINIEFITLSVLLWIVWVQLMCTTAEAYINETVYIEDGAESVELSCGNNVPMDRLALEWKVQMDSGWFDTIFKYRYTRAGSNPSYNGIYRDSPQLQEKYSSSTSVNTSLVVKNGAISDSNVYQCILTYEPEYDYRVQLQVVGK